MASKQELKRNFLGILMSDTVKELTKKTSDDVVMKKESKNNGVGMKNSRMRDEIRKLLGEMTHNCETESPGGKNTKLLREPTDKGESGSSRRNSSMVKEETVVKQENLSLADTIRKLQASNEGIAGIIR